MPIAEWNYLRNSWLVSFDVRPNASRFILLNGRELITQGLIDSALGSTHVICDSQSELMPPDIKLEIIRLWESMQHVLRTIDAHVPMEAREELIERIWSRRNQGPTRGS